MGGGDPASKAQNWVHNLNIPFASQKAGPLLGLTVFGGMLWIQQFCLDKNSNVIAVLLPGFT